MMFLNVLLTKIFGTNHDREVKRIMPLVDLINAKSAEMEALDDGSLAAKTPEFRERLAKGETLEDLLVEAFAVCREAADRRLGLLNVLIEEHGFDFKKISVNHQNLANEAKKKLEEGVAHHSLHFPATFYTEIRNLYPESRFPFRYRPFDVQLIGGVVLHHGKIAEMKTGEGKTVVATLPVYLNGLSGKGVHCITVNDYLAKRDAETMGRVYQFLQLSVSVIVHDLNETQRRENYLADVTYGTNSEFGFDYLRDNMARDIDDCVQRDLNFAIVDEVDSILVDEARTPLIISGPAQESTDKYKMANEVVRHLKKDEHYTVEEKDRHVSLTEEGVNLCEQRLGLENLYGDMNTEWVHHITQALRAHVLYKHDVDYVSKNGQIIIVDEFTGRMMEGRRYSEGLHQAIEAKEGVPIMRENQTLATITYQNYFRMYNKLAGMTGTADTEATEFNQIYKLRVVVIPTHRPMIRKDQDDLIYKTRKEKNKAIFEDIKERSEKGQPVLVGTISIEKSEELAKMLKREGIDHEVLNAKQHQREAIIIKEAGLKGRVTIATNMAGRGTDIQLGSGVSDLGGLYVLGTERHESRRIDNQLRGRSGRQGDPGESRFYLSLEDDLLRIFGAERIAKVMDRLGAEEGEVITHPLVNRAIANAQTRVEGQNFEVRKHLLDYDDVMNRQRTVIYKLRRRILKGEEIQEEILDRILAAVESTVSMYTSSGHFPENWDLERMYKDIKRVFDLEFVIREDELSSLTAEITVERIYNLAKAKYEAIETSVGSEDLREIERQVLLMIIDHVWREHLYTMDHLKDAIRFRGYAQRDPLQEYKKEGFENFEHAMERIANETAERVMHIDPNFKRRQEEALAKARELELLRRKQMELHSQVQLQSQPATAVVPTVSSPNRSLSPEAQRRMPASSPQLLRDVLSSTGRNDPCPCGSGKKFKKCHGANL